MSKQKTGRTPEFTLWHIRAEVLTYLAESPRRIRAGEPFAAERELLNVAKLLCWIGGDLDAHKDSNPLAPDRGGHGVFETGREMQSAINGQTTHAAPGAGNRAADLERQVARLEAALDTQRAAGKGGVN